MKHTPGPWKWVDSESDDYTNQHGTHQELIQSKFVGEAEHSICYHGADWRMKKENAQLIAAAPDLLDALVWLLEEIGPPEAPKHPSVDAIQSARAAIERVKGNKQTIKRYFIDLPNPLDPEAPYVNYDSYNSYEEALRDAQRLFGADENGKISLISETEEENDE